MKKCLTVFIALAVLAVAGAGWAATTTVAVSASVAGTCQFNNTGSVAFGALNQTTAPLVNGTVTNPQFWCTKNTAWTITDDLGAHETGSTFRMTNTAGTDFIPYTFTYTTTGTGAGKTAPISMDITATVAAGTYVDVPAGTYTDTVTLTILP